MGDGKWGWGLLGCCRSIHLISLYGDMGEGALDGGTAGSGGKSSSVVCTLLFIFTLVLNPIYVCNLYYVTRLFLLNE